MSSNVVDIAWGMPTISNADVVESKHWQSIAAHCDYLAAVRHLQQPVMIGRALSSSWASDSMGGRATMTLRVPAFTSWVMPGFMTATADSESADAPTVAMAMGTADTPVDTPKSTLPANGIRSALLALARWAYPPLMGQSDTPTDGDAFPLPVTLDEAQYTQLAVTFYIDPYCYVHAIRCQSAIAAGASLII